MTFDQCALRRRSPPPGQLIGRRVGVLLPVPPVTASLTVRGTPHNRPAAAVARAIVSPILFRRQSRLQRTCKKVMQQPRRADR